MMGYRIKRFGLYPILCIVFLYISGFLVHLQVLVVGTQAPFINVRNGEILILKYIHSMYGVEVLESMRIENGLFEIFHVSTSEAALEYFGIEKKDLGNVQMVVKEFSIPKESTGNHVLILRNRVLKINECGDEDGSVYIRIKKVPLLLYTFYSIRRERDGR